MSKWAVKLCQWCLKRADLSLQDRNQLVIHILDNLSALPISEIISYGSDGKLFINQRPLNLDEMRLLRESARTLLNSPARKLLKDQVAFTAIALGVHKVEKPEQMYFARAAIWYHQQFEEHLKLLAGEEQESTL